MLHLVLKQDDILFFSAAIIPPSHLLCRPPHIPAGIRKHFSEKQKGYYF